MRQLLIVAIETDVALDTEHLAIHVPRLINNARAIGEIIDETFQPREIVDAAKRCVGRLSTEQNISIHPELSRGEAVTMGLRLLADMVPTLADFDATLRAPLRAVASSERAAA